MFRHQPIGSPRAVDIFGLPVTMAVALSEVATTGHPFPEFRGAVFGPALPCISKHYDTAVDVELPRGYGQLGEMSDITSYHMISHPLCVFKNTRVQPFVMPWQTS